MGMLCDGELERMKELETIEQRSRRLRAVIDEWTAAIDGVREETFNPEHSIMDCDKTLRIPAGRAKRSH